MRTFTCERAGGRRAALADPFDTHTVHGETLLTHAVRGMLALGLSERVHVLAPAARAPEVARSVAGMSTVLHTSVGLLCGTVGSEVGFAGPGRPHSGERAEPTSGDGLPKNELDAVSSQVVLLHDAARPLVPAAPALAAVDAIRSGHTAAVPVLPLADTVKGVDAGGLITSTPDRATLRVVQTPQAFRADLLERVLAVAVFDPTSAWTALDGPVHTVVGHPSAFPVRGAWDAQLAGLLISGAAG